jgi:hypothetical protein
LGADDSSDIFGWDNKLAGARVLLARVKQPIYILSKIIKTLLIGKTSFNLFELAINLKKKKKKKKLLI